MIWILPFFYWLVSQKLIDLNKHIKNFFGLSGKINGYWLFLIFFERNFFNPATLGWLYIQDIDKFRNLEALIRLYVRIFFLNLYICLSHYNFFFLGSRIQICDSFSDAFSSVFCLLIFFFFFNPSLPSSSCLCFYYVPRSRKYKSQDSQVSIYFFSSTFYCKARLGLVDFIIRIWTKTMS